MCIAITPPDVSAIDCRVSPTKFRDTCVTFDTECRATQCRSLSERTGRLTCRDELVARAHEVVRMNCEPVADAVVARRAQTLGAEVAFLSRLFRDAPDKRAHPRARRFDEGAKRALVNTNGRNQGHTAVTYSDERTACGLGGRYASAVDQLAVEPFGKQRERRVEIGHNAGDMVE